MSEVEEESWHPNHEAPLQIRPSGYEPKELGDFCRVNRGRDIYVDTRTVDVHIGRLRKSLVENGHDDPIRTIRGVGYALG